MGSFGQATGTWFAGTGTGLTSDRTNILLGVLAYNYTIAAASTGSTVNATVTILPRYSTAASFNYEEDGVTSKSAAFTGAGSSNAAIGMAPTITYAPQSQGSGTLTLTNASRRPTY